MPFNPTKPASEIFDPLTAGGAPRGASMAEVQQWGIEVEEALDDAVDLVSSSNFITVASKAALKNVDPSVNTAVKVLDGRRDLDFVWATGNFSSVASDDPNEGIYITSSVVANTSGIWVRVLSGEVSPFHFDGVGDGSNDDAPALNGVFDYIRTLTAAAGEEFNASFHIDLSGGKWRTTESIDATDIVGWSLKITGGLLYGECAGKAILDLVGSRGYVLDNVAFHGDETNKPSCAYQIARPTSSGFADNQSFREVSTTGFFTRTAVHDYGHETATHDHCTYFNYEHTARVAIFEGYDEHPFTSDHSTVMTGGTSHINNKLVNCDFRYLPTGDNIASITGVTTGANAVVTAPGHAFEVGDDVVFASVGGMPGLNYVKGAVTGVSGNDITTDVNTTSLGTFTSGGSIIRAQEQASVYVARAEQLNFDCCYIVGYGQPQLELGFPDSSFQRLEQIDLDILFEGSGCASNVLFSHNNQNVSIQGFRFKTYNSNAYTALFSIPTGGSVTLYNPLVESVDPMNNVDLCDRPAALGMFGANILYPTIALVEYASFNDFNGRITEIQTGATLTFGVQYGYDGDGDFSPTIGADSGSFTSASGAGHAKYIRQDLVHVRLEVDITTNGTAATSVNAELPFTPDADGFLWGRIYSTGAQLVGIVTEGDATVKIVKAEDSTYPGGNGLLLQVSGSVEI